MLDRLIRAFLVVGGVSVACAWTWPGAFPEADPVAVLVRYHTPNVYRAVVAWYYVAPGVAVFLAGQFLISTSRIWFARMGVRVGLRSRLPQWPLSPSADGPAIVVGEVHHPVRAIESPAPEWLTIPERGLYTGVAIFGAVGSGKTSACMHPFARQLLSWQATNPERRAAALVLEVKGDFCHDIRRMLTELGRGGDYIELSLDGRLTWNPLSATWLDSYSLAYTVASLLNQLFGKGKEPFWQQAYTNLVRWIIELYRVLPGGWVTLRDVYHCAIDKALFAQKITQAQTYAAEMSDEWISVSADAIAADHLDPLRAFSFKQDGAVAFLATQRRDEANRHPLWRLADVSARPTRASRHTDMRRRTSGRPRPSRPSRRTGSWFGRGLPGPWSVPAVKPTASCRCRRSPRGHARRRDSSSVTNGATSTGSRSPRHTWTNGSAMPRPSPGLSSRSWACAGAGTGSMRPGRGPSGSPLATRGTRCWASARTGT